MEDEFRERKPASHRRKRRWLLSIDANSKMKATKKKTHSGDAGLG
jgi:hypothetical protein